MQTLTITVDDQGKMNVTGPIGNKLLAFGMLELAKDCIVKHHEQEEMKRAMNSIQPGTLSDLAVLEGRQ